jgi:hypothetical protein
MAFRDALRQPDQEIVEALTGVLGPDLDMGDTVGRDAAPGL